MRNVRSNTSHAGRAKAHDGSLTTRARLTLVLVALTLPGGTTLAKPPPAASPPASAASPPAAQPGNDVQPAVAEARRLTAQRQFALAESLLADAVRRSPDNHSLRMAWIDVALTQKQPAAALDRIRSAPPAIAESPPARLRSAQSLFALGRVLEDTEVRRFPRGRPGQFLDDRLLIELREPPDTFLCCGPNCALYQLRLALDAGLDEQAAHLLHARLWQQLRRPQVALSILQSREAAIRDSIDDESLSLLADLSLEAGSSTDFLRYSQLRADRQPERKASILAAAYRAVAECCAQRGEVDLHIQWLRRAARLLPDDSDLLLALADAEWAADQVPEAAANYRRLLRLVPHHPQRARIGARLAQDERGSP